MAMGLRYKIQTDVSENDVVWLGLLITVVIRPSRVIYTTLLASKRLSARQAI